MATKPAAHLDWTDGDPSKVTEPTSGKKLLGWTADERPPFQYFNWLFYTADLWNKYFEEVTDGQLIGVRNIAFGASPYTALTSDNYIGCDCTLGPITVNLPPVAANAGKMFIIDKKDSSGNVVTIDGSGTDPIAEALTQTLDNQDSTMSIVSNGTQWRVIA